MKLGTFILIAFSLSFISCVDLKEKRTTDKNTDSIDWDEIVIEYGSYRFIVEADLTEATLIKWNTKEAENGYLYRDHMNYKRRLFTVNKEEQDSLFACVYNIINKPVYTDQYATCYVGNLRISYRKSNTTLTCEYNSVGDWRTISPQTYKLDSLLNKMITKL